MAQQLRPAEDAVCGGLGYVAHATRLVDGDITLAAQFQNTLFNSFAKGRGIVFFADEDNRFLLKR